MKPLTLALILLLGLPLVASAQEINSYTEAQQWMLAEAQLVETLQSPVVGVRTQALKNAIVLATLYRDKVDLSSAVSAIEQVYEDDNAATRKLALAALQAIGDRWAAAYLARHVPPVEMEESRALVASVLNEYYGAKMAALQ